MDYFTKYVGLLMALNGVETAILKPRVALKNLKLKNDVVLELHQTALVHNRQASNTALIKYYSALAHKCLLQNFFDDFIDY